MGLDMYLYKSHYIGAHYEHVKARVAIDITVDNGGRKVNIDPMKVSEIIELAGYWRKANQIHKWFVDNTQDGEDRNGESDVSRDQLKELLATCWKVIESCDLETGRINNGYTFKNGKKLFLVEDGDVIKDPSVAMELLPSQSGFFFGSTDYDQYYLQDICDTIRILEALDLDDFHVDYKYCASW